MGAGHAETRQDATPLRICSYDPTYQNVFASGQIFLCIHVELFIPLAEMKLQCICIISA